MLMRTPTRIEFKAEDAQEYIKARERQKRQASTAASLTGAASSSRRGVAVASPNPPVQTATAPAPMVAAVASAPDSGAQYPLQVQQLIDMGFAPEQARRALGAADGDVEAAADMLLS
mmetsp:Transcript_91184/g.288954  ORF Transcript_91184/g.288954 Transcript_91184/m.288954 type:complete len:117 (-) Transcript_91184:101-451(-)